MREFKATHFKRDNNKFSSTAEFDSGLNGVCFKSACPWSFNARIMIIISHVNLVVRTAYERHINGVSYKSTSKWNIKQRLQEYVWYAGRRTGN